MRPKPEPSLELIMLRTVMHQADADDDKEDVTLARYRERMKNNSEWIMKELRAAEKDYRAEVTAWEKETKDEAAAKKAAREASKERPLEPCDVLVRRLLEDWGKIDQLRKAMN